MMSNDMKPATYYVECGRELVGTYKNYLQAEEAKKQLLERYGLHCIIVCDRGKTANAVFARL